LTPDPIAEPTLLIPPQILPQKLRASRRSDVTGGVATLAVAVAGRSPCAARRARIACRKARAPVACVACDACDSTGLPPGPPVSFPRADPAASRATAAFPIADCNANTRSAPLEALRLGEITAPSVRASAGRARTPPAVSSTWWVSETDPTRASIPAPRNRSPGLDGNAASRTRTGGLLGATCDKHPRDNHQIWLRAKPRNRYSMRFLGRSGGGGI
jgi:hypothetical protein